MPWKPREDVAESEGCFVMADAEGRPLGYFQELPDGSAGYWLEPKQPVRQARSPEEAMDRILARFFPLRVISIDEQGQRHENETFRWSAAYTDSRFFATSVLHVARRSGGELDVPVGPRRRIRSVQVVGNDGTVIDDDPV